MENPPAIISAAKLYEVQKYCSLTNHMWDRSWLLVNRNAWRRLPPDLQEIFANVVNAAAVAERADVAKQNNELRAELTSKGLVFNDVDPAPFRDALSKAGFYGKWKQRFGDQEWSLIEEYTGPLA